VFTDLDKNFIESQLFTTRHLGRRDVGEQFTDLIFRYDDIYVPERWDTEDRSRLRRSFDQSSVPELLDEWIKSEEWKTLVFERKRPKPVQMLVDMQRFARAKFNGVSAYLHQALLIAPALQKQFLNFMIEMSVLVHADYGFVAHTQQERRQSPILTPAERLPGIYWANFFGRPYIEFFGRDKLLNTPCYEVREINDDLILLLTADSFNAPEMIESDEEVSKVKAYLNQNAFAGANFPQESCAVPLFNFGDVRGTTEVPTEGSRDEKLLSLRSDLLRKGYRVIEDKNGRIVFVGTDGSIVLVDKNRAEVSVDLSGEFLKSNSSD
jgi:hypothetical protein